MSAPPLHCATPAPGEPVARQGRPPQPWRTRWQRILDGRWNAALVAIAVFAWLAWSAGARPLMLPDEGRYVGVAWEMLRSGDWLTPTLDGLPYFHKPPLFYWITATALRVFGLHEWAARLAPLLGATVGALAIWALLRRWSDARTARLALLALLVQPLWFMGAQFANLDMLVAGCITVTISLLAHAALSFEDGRIDRRALVAAWGAAALGVLAKGLIGFVLPALVIAIWLLIRRRWRTLLALFSLPGLLLFLVIAAPWFIAMQQRFGTFLHYFFVVQHFQRFASGGFNNAHPFWFYPALLALGMLPWLHWLRAGLRSTRHPLPAVAPTAVSGAGVEPSRISAAHGMSLRLLMLVWAAAVTVFFSLPQSKLIGYILPAVPPLAALVADGYARSQPGRPGFGRRAWTLAAVGAMLLSLTVAAVLTVRPSRTTRELGIELAHARAAAPEEPRGDARPVFALDNYPFDLAWAARLPGPIRVVERWDDAKLLAGDTWRKELADAAQFDPELGSQLLLRPAEFPAALCRAGDAWVIGPADSIARQPLLQYAQALRSVRGQTLWRVDAAAISAACAQRPNAD